MDGPSDDEDLVLLDRPAAGVARLTLNRPAARNALNAALRRALAQAFQALEDDASVRRAVIRGSQGCFAAGADASLAAGLQLERHAFELLFDTQDQKEGMRAFAQRRAPVFTGR